MGEKFEEISTFEEESFRVEFPWLHTFNGAFNGAHEFFWMIFKTSKEATLKGQFLENLLRIETNFVF